MSTTFNVQYRSGIEWDDTIVYENFENITDVLIHVLADWVAGDVDLFGTFSFLKDHGRDFGVDDCDITDESDPALLEAGSEAVLELCADNEALTKEYLITIGDYVRIIEVQDEE
jgi:hypothetical protein